MSKDGNKDAARAKQLKDAGILHGMRLTSPYPGSGGAMNFAPGQCGMRGGSLDATLPGSAANRRLMTAKRR